MEWLSHLENVYLTYKLPNCSPELFTILHSQQQCRSISVALYPCQTWYCQSVFLILSILICRGQLRYHWGGQFAWSLFKYLLTICISTFLKYLLKNTCQLFIGLSSYWVVRIIFIVSKSPLSDICIMNIFSQSSGLPF